MPHILIVEDHRTLRLSVMSSLREAGWDVEGADTLAAANEIITKPFDVIILDLMLPDGSGLEWLAQQRAQGNRALVLVLTARDAVEDRVAGLDVGADDYLTKPFSLDELLARIRALSRRLQYTSRTVFSFADITVDLLSRRANRAGQGLSLQNRQFELLTYLIQHAGQIVTREMIARDVWREPTATWTNVIEVQINQLRRKLDVTGGPAILHTIRNQGYMLGDAP